VGIPIYRSTEELEKISEKFDLLRMAFKKKGISFKYDDDDNRRPGWKFSEYETKGVPIRLAMGPRDLENGNIEVARRDTKTKEIVSFDGVEKLIEGLLKEIQSNLFNKADRFRKEKTSEASDFESFKQLVNKGGFVSAHWDGTEATENKIKEETQATIRCIPLDQKEETGVCVYSGAPSKGKVLFAKAY